MLTQNSFKQQESAVHIADMTEALGKNSHISKGLQLLIEKNIKSEKIKKSYEIKKTIFFNVWGMTK